MELSLTSNPSSVLVTGKPAVRWDHVGARLGKVVVFVLAQARLIGGDFWPGLMHATIFWGFIVLTLGTLEFFGKGVTESFFLPFLSDTPAYLVLQDLFSVAVIVAIAYATFRRTVTRPRRLTLSPEGLVILLMIFGLMVTDLVADAGRIVLLPRRPITGSSRERYRRPSRARLRRRDRCTTRRGGSRRPLWASVVPHSKHLRSSRVQRLFAPLT
jgi:hypothetical protein